jgi:hypothetical protein
LQIVTRPTLRGPPTYCLEETASWSAAPRARAAEFQSSLARATARFDESDVVARGDGTGCE